jgi:hypothetical protein
MSWLLTGRWRGLEGRSRPTIAKVTFI